MTLPLIFDEMLPELLHKALRYCKLLQVLLPLVHNTVFDVGEAIAKFDDVGICLYMFVMFYPLVL